MSGQPARSSKPTTARGSRKKAKVDSASALAELTTGEYKYGFVTDVESDRVPPGLNEEIIRLISRKKEEPEFMLEWRLKAYRHWLTMTEPTWANVTYPPIDYQGIVYYSAPRTGKLARAAKRPQYGWLKNTTIPENEIMHYRESLSRYLMEAELK